MCSFKLKKSLLNVLILSKKSFYSKKVKEAGNSFTCIKKIINSTSCKLRTVSSTRTGKDFLILLTIKIYAKRPPKNHRFFKNNVRRVLSKTISESTSILMSDCKICLRSAVAQSRNFLFHILFSSFALTIKKR